MPMSDDVLRITFSVQNREKMWRELAFPVLHRKVFLMIAHHGDQHFLGKRQKFAIGSIRP